MGGLIPSAERGRGRRSATTLPGSMDGSFSLDRDQRDCVFSVERFARECEVCSQMWLMRLNRCLCRRWCC